MRLRVKSAEVQTLNPSGGLWEGIGSRIPKAELPRFFALGLSEQLERLVASGSPPNPPDVMVRLRVAGTIVLETDAEESFEPVWPQDGPEVELEPATEVCIEVYDLDLVWHDVIGKTTVRVPERPTGGLWTLGPFGQVRKLVLYLE